MSDEIKEILDVENYRNKDGYVENINLLPDEIHKLLDYITNLQTIEREYSSLLSENAKLQQENDKLNNITNELEKWCNECIDNHIIARENGATTISDTFFEIVLDKLKALKENK